MAESIPALVNPAMLEWARERAGFSQESAAAHAKVPQEKLRAWELGEIAPTLRQAEGLAKFYHCAYSIFCLESPPIVPPLAAEYRRLCGVEPGEEPPEFRFALRQMMRQRRLSLWLTDELGEAVDSFEYRIGLSQNAEIVAAELRKALGVPIESQKAWRDEFQAWRVWREAVEQKGVLVFQFSKVPLEVVRGVCILDFPSPVVGVNSKEIPASKPFTLLHEFVHLALANARQESPALTELRPDKEWEAVEQFAEEVAGATLLPREALLADPLICSHESSEIWKLFDIRPLARKYKVTPLAMVTRLLRLGKCTPAAYRQWKEEWQEYLDLHPPKPPFSKSTPAQKAVNRIGQPFTRLVLEALTRDRITSVDASRYLNLRYPYVEDLRRDLTLGLPGFAGGAGG